MDKPPIDNDYMPDPPPKSRLVEWEHGETLLRRLKKAGYVITKTIETDLSLYVEYTWEVEK